ncbi:hypothetical protein GCM10008915_56520 [Bifidobacterium pullorum subsp. gallinarum]
MGWVKHNFIIVTHYNFNELVVARELAMELFNLDEFPREINLVSEILQSVANNYYSFFCELRWI